MNNVFRLVSSILNRVHLIYGGSKVEILESTPYTSTSQLWKIGSYTTALPRYPSSIGSQEACTCKNTNPKSKRYIATFLVVELAISHTIGDMLHFRVSFESH